MNSDARAVAAIRSGLVPSIFAPPVLHQCAAAPYHHDVRISGGGSHGNEYCAQAFKKAQRRKLRVAEKRRVEALEASLPARVFRAAQAPIQHCLLTESVFDIGFGTLVLARGATPYHVVLGSFLVDTFCLGIKDVMFCSVDGETFDGLREAWDAASPMAPVDPSYARKLLRDLAAWSQSLSFAPHRDFAVVETLFGEVNANASDAVFQFGRDGKPLYIPGPSESSLQIRHRVEHLRNTLGDGGFVLGAAG